MEDDAFHIWLDGPPDGLDLVFGGRQLGVVFETAPKLPPLPEPPTGAPFPTVVIHVAEDGTVRAEGPLAGDIERIREAASAGRPIVLHVPRYAE